MRIADVLGEANIKMKAAGIENYFYETKALLAHILNKGTEWVTVHIFETISQSEADQFNEYINMRINRVPFQYILGCCSFMGNDFFVNGDVLIPGADTEILVEEVYKLVSVPNKVKVLDMCTGSGCIAISLKKKFPDIEVIGCDISQKALEMAKKNAAYNNVQVEFLKSDLFESIGNRKFDIIVSNPPYISTEEMESLQPEVKMEPHLALDGGTDGLKFYKKIVEESQNFLKPRGTLAVEIGYNQEKQVRNIFESRGFKDCKSIKDYSGNYRVVAGTKGREELEQG